MRLALLAAALFTNRGFAEETPLQKVIVLLQKLQAKLKEEGKAEAASYDKYACFCKEEADEKHYNIEKSKEMIEKLSRNIDKLNGEITDLDSDISDLSGTITELEQNMDSAQTSRTESFKIYEGEKADIVAAIDAVERAIKMLKDKKGQLKGSVDGFLQVDSLSTISKQILGFATHVAIPDTGVDVLTQLASGQPGKANQYAFHSNDIIETLKSVRTTFINTRNSLDEDERQDKQLFDKDQLARANKKKFAKKDREEAEAQSAAKQEEKEKLIKKKDKEVREKIADQEYLEVLMQSCSDKARLYDQRLLSRQQELNAMGKATEILEANAGTYQANKRLVGLEQKATLKPIRPVSFLQARQTKDAAVVELVANAANKLQSSALSTLLLKMQSSADHFVKIRGLIQDLIDQLEEQAKAEATQKDFCDQKISAAKKKQQENSEEYETEKVAEAGKNAQISKLKTENTEKRAEIMELAAAYKTAYDIRKEEKLENEQTIKDAKSGRDAVESAITVLGEYYSTEASSDATDTKVKERKTVQDRSGNTVGDNAPEETFQETYSGNSDAGTNIIKLLEVIQEDFSRTIEDTEQTETDAEAKIKEFESETKKTTKALEVAIDENKGSMESLTSETMDHQNAAKDAKEDEMSATDELAAISPQCVETESHAERTAKREEEIAALKQALDILTGMSRS